MMGLMSYAIALLFIASIALSILLPEQEQYLMLIYVLASPALLVWIGWRARN